MKKYKPVVLVILDGWGLAPPSPGNAVTLAQTPIMESLIKDYPATTLQASGEAVGLPWEEMGNSEVGHLNLGSGRIIFQHLPRINNAIETGIFFENKAFLKAITHVKKNNSRLHLMGLVSPGGVHSHEDHLYALLELAKRQGVKEVFIHAFLDGRDTPPQSGISYLQALERQMANLRIGKIASICGRFFALDRDNHWERIKLAYEAIVQGEGRKVTNFYQEIKKDYESNIYDENIVPLVIGEEDGKPVALVSDNDSLIFFNYRSDRAQEITQAFILPGFNKFERGKARKNLFFVAMTQYDQDLPCEIAFPKEEIQMTLAETLSKGELHQLHIAETEKYAHITRFFDGGREKAWPGEDFILIDSPRVKNYAQVPEMSAYKISERVLGEIAKKKYGFIVVNFANLDMVGHTGNLSAAIKAVETVDTCLGKIREGVLSQEGALVVTADHGNVEEMLNLQTGTIDTEHSKNPVPLILAARELQGKGRGKKNLLEKEDGYPIGLLSDVAPTILAFLGIPKPQEMTGIDLLEVLLKSK